MSILLPTLVVLAVLIGLFCTYLIKRRNSLMLGALANLTLLVLLIALVQLISLYNNNWFWVVVFSTVIIVVGLAVFLGLTLSFIFFFINAFIVWKREGHSLSSSLTLIAGIGVVGVDALLLFYPSFGPAPLQAFMTTFLTLLIGYVLLTVWNTITSILLYRLYFPKKDKDYIIVLGAGLIDGYKVGRLLGNRIDKAIQFYQQEIKETGKHPKLVFSGGQGGDELLPEGEAMQKYALDHGIPESDTLIEAKSVNTLQNLKFSREIIEKDSGKKNSKVIFVSNNYHTLRAGIYARKLKFPAFGVGAPTPFYFLPNAVIREHLAFLVMNKRWNIAIFSLIIIIAILMGVTAAFSPISPIK
ncbi:YdcF family protein [Lentilactobacillus kefiri]|nr:YdcF family protein [Lentilactobacillus kefiri]MCJ2162679.1 YdcF family protein [Lentilactobacillus kefiri]MCP9368709.1 YdcF family protein [Lentilactobacillus kefiri]MDH5107936.1 YdcF family protein [Lentilactobacillus kefiri]MDM7492295.1 YdcF family protein [Lentilactobacillus kefiri]PAK60077.1 hypothetical protein B9K02_03290 [Lentilactobacillus kefiri]